MKKCVAVCVFVLIFSVVFTFMSNAEEYEFNPEEDDESVDNNISAFLDSLPKDIKKVLIPIEDTKADEISNNYSYSFFKTFLIEKLKQLLPAHLKSASAIMAMMLVVGLLKLFQKQMMVTKLNNVTDMCSSLVLALTVLSGQKEVLAEVEVFLSTLSNTMLMLVPVMESIYISTGNYTLMAVSSTGLNLMITFTLNLFSKIILPAITVSFVIATTASITQNKAITYIARCLRTIITTILIISMTLMSFSLTLQIDTATATDNFTNRTIRFALGSYIPIVGGTVSETYSIMRSSISLIKSLTGTSAIVALLLICAQPIISISLNRIMISISKNIAGLVECDGEENLFTEIGSCYTLLISVVISCVVMYIIAIAQFSKASVGIN